MKTLPFLFIGLTALAAAGIRSGDKANVGEVTPNWTAADSVGKTRSVEDYRGKFVVLEWTNKDCPFVKKHYGSGNMQATQEKAKEMGAVWLTVISSAPGNQGYMAPDQINAYRKSMKVNSAATLLDSDGKIGHIYEAKTTPQIVVINPKGVVVYNGAIDNKPSTDVADIPTSTNYALAALKEGMAGKAVTVATSRPYGCSVKY